MMACRFVTKVAMLACLVSSVRASSAFGWQVTFGNGSRAATNPILDVAGEVAFDAAGDVFVVAMVDCETGGSSAERGTVVVAKLAGSSGAELWRIPIGFGKLSGPYRSWPHTSNRGFLQLVVTAAGDVVAGYAESAPPSATPVPPAGFAVVKLAGTDGSEMWRYRHGVAGSNGVYDLALNASGDVIAGGVTGTPVEDERGTVVKLSGTSGTLQWRVDDPALSWVEAVAVAPDGSVLTGGPATVGGIRVAKRAAVDGATIWDREISALRSVGSLVSVAGGDVVSFGGLDAMVVSRLSGVDGSTVWSTALDEPVFQDAAIRGMRDLRGDLVAVGMTAAGMDCGSCSRFTVAKIAAADGTLVWRRDLTGTKTLLNPGTWLFPDGAPRGVWNDALAVAIHPARVCSGDGTTPCGADTPDCDGNGTCLGGDVIAAGELSNAATHPDVAVVRLAAADGGVRWRRTIDGSTPGFGSYYDMAVAVAVDAGGDVAAAGMLGERVDDAGNGDIQGLDLQALVVKRDGATGCSTSATIPASLDSDGDMLVDICDNCPGVASTLATDSDRDGAGDLCDPCPSDADDGCAPAQSVATLVGPAGGVVTVPDGSTSVSVAPGVLAEDTIVSVTGGGSTSAYAVSEQGTPVLITSLTPDDVVFPAPVTVTFAWPDADDDGVVDGTAVSESTLQVWRNGVAVTGPCEVPAHAPGTCTTACCDRTLNQWALQVTHFSEYVTAKGTGAGCAKAVTKEATKLAIARAKAIAKCEVAKVKGTLGAATVCDTQVDVSAAVGKARAAFGGKVDKVCGGNDRQCLSGGGPGDTPLVALGWPTVCPNLASSSDSDCGLQLDGCAELTSCIDCTQRAATERLGAFDWKSFALPSSTKDVQACQRTLVQQGQRYYAQALKVLRKCWDARDKGAHSSGCPDALAPVGSPAEKASTALAKLRAQMLAKICSACGGADGLCGGAGDLAPGTIGFAGTCASLGTPSGATCDGPVATLSDLATCAACVAEFAASCTDLVTVPRYRDYPAVCNP